MPPKVPASRKSTGAITTTTIKTRTTDRRKSAPTPAAATADPDYDADMPPPSSQRSDGDSQERLKTVAKSAKDNFRATADRCAIIRDSIGQAEEDVRALNVQLVQSCAKKDATFLKALQAQLDTLVVEDAVPVNSSNVKKHPPLPPPSNNTIAHTSSPPDLHTTTTTLLSLCASLESHYTTATHTLTSALTLLQPHIAVSATWPADQADLIATLKAGARIVDRQIRSLTDEETDNNNNGKTEEEMRVVQVLGLTEALGMQEGGGAGVHEVMRDARSGLKRMTRGLPESVAGGNGQDDDMTMM